MNNNSWLQKHVNVTTERHPGGQQEILPYESERKTEREAEEMENREQKNEERTMKRVEKNDCGKKKKYKEVHIFR